jgi:hypothetical protein
VSVWIRVDGDWGVSATAKMDTKLNLIDISIAACGKESRCLGASADESIARQMCPFQIRLQLSLSTSLDVAEAFDMKMSLDTLLKQPLMWPVAEISGVKILV